MQTGSSVHILQLLKQLGFYMHVSTALYHSIDIHSIDIAFILTGYSYRAIEVYIVKKMAETTFD